MRRTLVFHVYRTQSIKPRQRNTNMPEVTRDTGARPRHLLYGLGSAMDKRGHLRSVSDLIEKSYFHLNRQDRESVLAVFFGLNRPDREGRNSRRPGFGTWTAPRKEVRHRKEEKAWIRQERELQEEAPPTQGDMQRVWTGNRDLCKATAGTGPHVPELRLCRQENVGRKCPVTPRKQTFIGNLPGKDLLSRLSRRGHMQGARRPEEWAYTVRRNDEGRVQRRRWPLIGSLLAPILHETS